MKFHPKFVSLATFALVAALSLNACKKAGNTQATDQQTAQNPQPAASQPAASQPAPSQPAYAPQPASQPAAAPQPASAPQPAPPPAPAANVPPPPPQPTVVELPRGTVLRVYLDEDLGSQISRPGQNFRATVANDVQVNGQILIPRGSHAEGTVTDAQPLGKIKGGARLSLTLQQVHTPWGRYPVATSSIDRAEQGKGKRTAIMGGGGAGLGAIIGGIAGGGKGALIGGLAGGGAGTAGSAFTGNKQIVLPAETVLTFRLEHSVHITTQQ